MHRIVEKYIIRQMERMERGKQLHSMIKKQNIRESESQRKNERNRWREDIYSITNKQNIKERERERERESLLPMY